MSDLKTFFESLLNRTAVKDTKEWKNACLTEDFLKKIDAQLEMNGISTYKGKVRVCLSKANKMQIVHTDRLSAFDRHIDFVPQKGTILCAISTFWFEKIKERFPTHYLKQLDARSLLVKQMKPIKAEVIVRGYLAGSILRAYQSGERSFCGISLPDGLKPYQRLPEPIITPTTKAEAFEHDENTSAEGLIAKKLCTKKEWDHICEIALELFQFGQDIYASCGWLLADTKYEFGKDDSGKIHIIDEIHTPDSSRLWEKQSYQERFERQEAPKMLDKENVRGYLISAGFQGEGEVPDVPAEEIVKLAMTYLEVAEKLDSHTLSIYSGPIAIQL